MAGASALVASDAAAMAGGALSSSINATISSWPRSLAIAIAERILPNSWSSTRRRTLSIHKSFVLPVAAPRRALLSLTVSSSRCWLTVAVVFSSSRKRRSKRFNGQTLSGPYSHCWCSGCFEPEGGCTISRICSASSIHSEGIRKVNDQSVNSREVHTRRV